MKHPTLFQMPPAKSNATAPREFAVVPVRVLETPSITGDTPQTLADYWHSHIATAPHFNPCVEYIAAILLNTKYRILGHHICGMGSVNESIAHPREIFRAAIIQSAYAFAVMHNHPSGDPTPSDADRRITARLKESATILQIHLLDHVIVGNPEANPSYFSFRESGMI